MCYTKSKLLGTLIFALIAAFSSEAQAQNFLDLTRLHQWVYSGENGDALPKGWCEFQAEKLVRNRQGRLEQDFLFNAEFENRSEPSKSLRFRSFPTRQFAFASSCDRTEKTCLFETPLLPVLDDGRLVENPEFPLRLEILSQDSSTEKLIQINIKYEVQTGPNRGEWVSREACVKLEKAEAED